MHIVKAVTILGLPLLAYASPAVQIAPIVRDSPAGQLPAPTTTPPTTSSSSSQGQLPKPTSSSSSSSSYDYSFEVGLSGFDGSITHYSLSYSDPYVSGVVGVGHSQPTPSPITVVNNGIVCNRDFPGLLSFLGLDLGLRLNLSLLGIDACLAL
ncbi:hypothetical protein IWW57_006368 [Coemansia sp. S610]|nr:hypothetical protein IWW57_006368 [Coemansia sp. S610]